MSPAAGIEVVFAVREYLNLYNIRQQDTHQDQPALPPLAAVV